MLVASWSLNITVVVLMTANWLKYEDTFVMTVYKSLPLHICTLPRWPNVCWCPKRWSMSSRGTRWIAYTLNIWFYAMFMCMNNLVCLTCFLCMIYVVWHNMFIYCQVAITTKSSYTISWKSGINETHIRLSLYLCSLLMHKVIFTRSNQKKYNIMH